jgi:hypothetical protein
VKAASDHAGTMSLLPLDETRIPDQFQSTQQQLPRPPPTGPIGSCGTMPGSMRSRGRAPYAPSIRDNACCAEKPGSAMPVPSFGRASSRTGELTGWVLAVNESEHFPPPPAPTPAPCAVSVRDHQGCARRPLIARIRIRSRILANGAARRVSPTDRPTPARLARLALPPDIRVRQSGTP